MIAEAQKHALETLTDEIGEAGAKRQVANYEEVVDEWGDDAEGKRLAGQRALMTGSRTRRSTTRPSRRRSFQWSSRTTT